MSVLQPRQDETTPMTAEEIVALHRRAFEVKRDMEKLLFQKAFSNYLLKVITRKSESTFEFNLLFGPDFGYYIGLEWVPFPLDSETMGRLAEYFAERLSYSFPDYEVVCKFVKKRTGFLRTKEPCICGTLTRKDAQHLTS
jgi:hypothetical protein